jgi:hypothetical protein
VASSDDSRPEDDDAAPDGSVSDAQWSRMIEALTSPAEARGTHDSFAQPADAVLQAVLAGRPAWRSWGGRIGPAILASAAASWRRVLAGIDRWLRKSPAPLTLPAGPQTRFTIGREPACDMTLPDRTVSRWHASLKREDDGWLLTDLGSTNGTRLNGWRVNAPISVAPGDLVSFGAATFVLTERPRLIR